MASRHSCCSGRTLRRNAGPWEAVNVNVIQQAYMERKIPQNVDLEPVLTFGVWHRYEYLMVLNDIGKANGRLRMWMDGKLIMDYGDIEYRTAAYPSGFFGRRWDPIWGGARGRATPPRRLPGDRPHHHQGRSPCR